MEIIPKQCKKHSKKVVKFSEIKELIYEMAEICNRPCGKYPRAHAIAHCQVDHDNPKRFFVLSDGTPIINPVILEASRPFTHKEGCYSYAFRPEKKVKRYFKIKVQYQNEKGKKIVEDLEGLIACIFQHEIDHLNGIAVYG